MLLVRWARTHRPRGQFRPLIKSWEPRRAHSPCKIHQLLVHGFPQRVDSVCVAMVAPKAPFPGDPNKLQGLQQFKPVVPQRPALAQHAQIAHPESELTAPEFFVLRDVAVPVKVAVLLEELELLQPDSVEEFALDLPSKVEVVQALDLLRREGLPPPDASLAAHPRAKGTVLGVTLRDVRVTVAAVKLLQDAVEVIPSLR